MDHVLYILSSQRRVGRASEINSMASETHRIALNDDIVGCMFVHCNSSSLSIKREVENAIGSNGMFQLEIEFLQI